MSSQFPFAKDSFTDKIDNVDPIMAADFNNIYHSLTAVQGAVLSLIQPDDSLLLLCHFNESTAGHKNQTGSYSGPLRYENGKFYQGVLIEEGTTNLVTNPAFRSAATGWAVNNSDAGLCTGSRVTDDYPTPTDYSFAAAYKAEVTTAGDVDSSACIDLGSLSADTKYAISFWVKTEDSFSATNGVYITSGAGLQGTKSTKMDYTATSTWQRVTGTVTTGSGQSTFILEICFDKTGAGLGDKILVSGIQVEEKDHVTSYCDGTLGTGYSWSGTANESTSIRSETSLTYSTANNLDRETGAIGFWMKPIWAGDDGSEHIIFDTAIAANQNRIQIKKDTANKLCFTIWDGTADSYKKVTSSDAMSWSADTWIFIVCTYNSGTLTIYKGEGASFAALSTSGSGSGTGILTSLPSTIYLGHDYSGSNYASAIYDEFFIKDTAAALAELQNIFNSSIEMSGLKLVVRGIPLGHGTATTHATAETETSVEHGLGAAPSFIEITEKGGGVVYLSNDSDSTNFYVKATENSIEFDWRAWL